MRLTRRRFLSITTGAAGAASLGAGATQAATVWQGIAMGARAEIRVDHPMAPDLIAAARAEIARLEDIFSLYRGDTEISRLNRDGALAAPSPELLDCLALSATIHRASGGRFDPTVQPLWAAWAEAAARGTRPAATDLAGIPRGLAQVRLDSAAITMAPGMGLTLNGIAQGYVADRVARLLRAEGLRDVLIDTGELAALPGRTWPVTLEAGGSVALADRALASSARLGTTFDAGGQLGHILDPVTGTPGTSPWAMVAVSAPSAALADGLSTAICLMPDHAALDTLMAAFPTARIEALA